MGTEARGPTLGGRAARVGERTGVDGTERYGMTTPETPTVSKTLVVACGALARELVAVVRANKLDHLTITCLPAILHNRPERIAEAVRDKIRAHRAGHERVLCLYGDCGTGGALDRVLAEEGAERIEGAHCYAFYLGTSEFDALMEEELGSLFLTDYLVRHFERLIVQGLGLDRFPELRDMIFGHYKRVVYLAQVEDADLRREAEAAAARLGLAFEVRHTGLERLAKALVPPRPVSAAA